MTTVLKKSCAKLKRLANGSVYRLVKEITAVMSSNAHLRYVDFRIRILRRSLTLLGYNVIFRLFRVCKPSVALLVWLSTSRSRLATGRNR
jgi:hypothetical protein